VQELRATQDLALLALFDTDDDIRQYLTTHGRMSKHVSAITAVRCRNAHERTHEHIHMHIQCSSSSACSGLYSRAPRSCRYALNGVPIRQRCVRVWSPLPRMTLSAAAGHQPVHDTTVWCLFPQAAFQAMDLPVERLGYTYIVCAAGGSLVFDNFAGSIEQRQSVTSDLRRLSRSFVYASTARSSANPRVLRRCGVQIDMNVRT
jgi:hypothetical protein